MSFTTLCVLGVLFGVGFGFATQRSGLCFAHGLGELFIGRGRRILRLFLVIFIITSLGFFLSGLWDPSLGLKPVGQIRGYGFWNLVSGLLFGAGIMIGGGCVLGTLRQIGEGHLLFVITFLSWIPGMALVTRVINPWLAPRDVTAAVLLPELLGVPAEYVVVALVLLAALWLRCLLRDRSCGLSKG